MVDTLTRPDQPTDPNLADMSSRARAWLLAVACLDVLMVIASMVALNAALPDIALDTSASQTQLTWVVDGYTLVLACLLLPAGAVGDRYGRRGALLAGLVIFGLASVAPIVFDSPLQIILARAVAGAGAAFIMPATLSLLTAAFPKSERNKAVGIWAGVAGSGAVVGFLGTGTLLHFFNWQSIFWAFAIGALALFALTCTIRSSRDETGKPVDWIGGVLIAAAVAVFVFGVIEAPARGWSHPSVWGCMAVGLTLTAAFTAVQLRRRYPLLDVRLFRRPDFATGAIGITCLFAANFGFFFVVMQYMQLVLEYTPLQTAFALVPLAIPVLVLGATTHLWLPRTGLRNAVMFGLILIAAGLLCMRTLAVDSSFLDLAWPLLIISAGIGLCTAPTTSAIMGAVPDDKQGVASAVNDTTREVGAALGIAAAGSVLAAQYQHLLAPSVAALPEAIRGPALDSLAQAMAVAERSGPAGSDLAGAAQTAFLSAMDVSMTVLAVALLAAGLFIGLWSPGRDGRQFRLVRRWRSGPRARRVRIAARDL
ncbi:MFS transporter [Mycolicibacterium sp. S2-37]|uniref:MFS transporter n=1 Tax=Mycolicibacterium sp. S2-37 TaxID=2810297 RepID=UPI001A945298|nr:MFS transporter [Mycolicibacterium sp. S2-37]MBO0678936.1 MFS transporter [Mycolicibacterium sp. S2-37]